MAGAAWHLLLPIPACLASSRNTALWTTSQGGRPFWLASALCLPRPGLNKGVTYKRGAKRWSSGIHVTHNGGGPCSLVFSSPTGEVNRGHFCPSPAQISCQNLPGFEAAKIYLVSKQEQLERFLNTGRRFIKALWSIPAMSSLG